MSPLVHAVEVDHWPGGPFGPDLVTSAGDDVRGACGWHIAPRLAADEILVSGPTGARLVLPSLLIVEVTAVHDVVADTPVTGWRRGVAGMLIRDAGWPRGEDNLLVTLTHGHETCPGDLIPVVVERARGLGAPAPSGQRSFARDVGGVRTATTYADPATAPAWSLAAESVLARYRV